MVEFRGSEPSVAWRESGKPLRKNHSQFTQLRFEPRSPRPQQQGDTCFITWETEHVLHYTGDRGTRASLHGRQGDTCFTTRETEHVLHYTGDRGTRASLHGRQNTCFTTRETGGHMLYYMGDRGIRASLYGRQNTCFTTRETEHVLHYTEDRGTRASLHGRQGDTCFTTWETGGHVLHYMGDRTCASLHGRQGDTCFTTQETGGHVLHYTGDRGTRASLYGRQNMCFTTRETGGHMLHYMGDRGTRASLYGRQNMCFTTRETGGHMLHYMGDRGTRASLYGRQNMCFTTRETGGHMLHYMGDRGTRASLYGRQNMCFTTRETGGHMLHYMGDRGTRASLYGRQNMCFTTRETGGHMLHYMGDRGTRASLYGRQNMCFTTRETGGHMLHYMGDREFGHSAVCVCVCGKKFPPNALLSELRTLISRLRSEFKSTFDITDIKGDSSNQAEGADYHVSRLVKATLVRESLQLFQSTHGPPSSGTTWDIRNPSNLFQSVHPFPNPFYAKCKNSLQSSLHLVTGKMICGGQPKLSNNVELSKLFLEHPVIDQVLSSSDRSVVCTAHYRMMPYMYPTNEVMCSQGVEPKEGEKVERSLAKTRSTGARMVPRTSLTVVLSYGVVPTMGAGPGLVLVALVCSPTGIAVSACAVFSENIAACLSGVILKPV
uniref:Uncharacterized protein n=1 Tax=Timema bartmani TaxID=61472 RepID=A0A7R9ESK5_9NEOP|nr:unnamed protein product [Timema bartmani]